MRTQKKIRRAREAIFSSTEQSTLSWCMIETWSSERHEGEFMGNDGVFLSVRQVATGTADARVLNVAVESIKHYLLELRAARAIPVTEPKSETPNP